MSYSREHHAAYMREWRKVRKLSADQQRRADCRHYSRLLEKRGKIVREPCQKCGDSEVQRHHLNYDDAYLIVWLCVPCHRDCHDQFEFT